MSTEELLIDVKKGMLISGDYNDASLKIYIEEAKDHMKEAGISDTYIDSKKAVGIITLIVSDLYGTEKKLSEYTQNRLYQLRVTQHEENKNV